MELKQLKVFLAVADAKSFLKAADSLFITRQAISKTIKQLEDEIGLDLFERNQNGAVMTPAGMYLYPRAQALIAEADKLKSDVMDVHRSYRQTVRVYMSQGIYGHFASNLMAYGETYSSSVELKINSCLDSECETILADRKADIVLSYTPISPNIGKSVKLFDSPVMFLINDENDLLTKIKLSVRDLYTSPLLLYTNGQGRSLWWYDHPRSTDICCGDLNYLFTLLKENAGILPIAGIAIPPFLDFAEGLPAPELISPIPIYFSTLYPENYTSMAYKLIEDIAENVFKKRGAFASI